MSHRLRFFLRKSSVSSGWCYSTVKHMNFDHRRGRRAWHWLNYFWAVGTTWIRLRTPREKELEHRFTSSQDTAFPHSGTHLRRTTCWHNRYLDPFSTTRLFLRVKWSHTMTPSQQQRPESPPYTTSETNQSLEAYQKQFWQRQMARVEEQVSIPDEGTSSINTLGEGGSSNAALMGNKDLMDLFKPQAGQLPLARIKKVMKASDDQVKVSVHEPI
jgi:hypothetical protein